MRQILACLFLPADVADEVSRLQHELADYHPLLPPHVTLAPPVDADAQGRAIEARLRAAAAGIGPLRLDIGPSDTFGEAAPVVYFRVGGDGLADLHRLNDALVAGDPPAEHPFVPHATLVRGLDRDVLQSCLDATSSRRWQVEIDELRLLSLWHDTTRWYWSGHATIALTGP